MTNQEAIMGIKEIRRFFAEINPELVFSTLAFSTTIKCCDMAIKALEKQIPKKFKMKDDYTPVCPVCGEEVWDMEYCDGCGQLLSDEAED